MDRVFPLGFPLATSLYLTLYVGLLVIHVLLLSYVLAGAGYLAVVSTFTGPERLPRQRSSMVLTLRDWLPFALSVAITAGVAPLLLVQILYKKPFYTANLLLLHDWMAIVPVLIVGFYMLYVLKSRGICGWPATVRIIVGLGAFLCLLFAAYSWSRNHLLSLQSELWPEMYISGPRAHHHAGLLPRLGVWLFGSLPIMCTWLCWQLRYARKTGAEVPRIESRRASLLALGGLFLAVLCGGWYYQVIGESAREQIIGPFARPYLVLLVSGLIAQTLAWLGQWRAPELSKGWLIAASAGAVATVVGTTVAREAIRLASLDIDALQPAHARAAEVGGFPVFLFFLVFSAAVIVWCMMLTKRGLHATSTSPKAED